MGNEKMGMTKRRSQSKTIKCKWRKNGAAIVNNG
jgi:hypothetical protein